jgi:predicted nucleotidyltransferase
MDGSKRLSDADLELIKGIVSWTREQNAREAEAIEARLQMARAEARGLARRLGSDPAVRRVLFFGSASTGRRFRLDSDIDLAVEGGDILAHLGIVEKSAFPVDVIDIQALPEPYREGIEAEGELLYEKLD